MSDYVTIKRTKQLPRIPLEGKIDLTYRCNNNCRHCWLRIPEESPERENELTFDEITKIVDEARSMGCHRWSISGGEPMLRDDFSDIFDYITRKSVSYSLNTNGTLITPQIARLLKRKGTKMIALYGATAEVHDYITRSPGSFDAVMRGFAYLKEAEAGFIVQITLMKDNYHQYDEMVQLAESLSPNWRNGTDWLYLSADGNPIRNKEIIRQRLDPKNVVELAKPDLFYGDWVQEGAHTYTHINGDDRLFASCISGRRDFDIDPYGHMSFCFLIKDSALRYCLKKGSFKECWEEFIPSLANKVIGGKEYLENCASCEFQKDCRWCPVYGYMEHRRFSAKVEYLCDIARENKKFKDNWGKNNRRYFQIAGMTIQVDSDLPITDATFHPKFDLFEVIGPGEDNIFIRHHFSMPKLNGQDLGKEVYRKSPWAIFRKGDSWLYMGISSYLGEEDVHRVAVFSHDYTRARIYNDGEAIFSKGDLDSITLFPTDQIVLAQLLADREGCFLHSAGVILDNKGLLFVGHSDAGKSTIVTMLKDKAEILCDDRMILRRWQDGFRIHGTWSHGDVPDVSAASAPLNAILFLEQAKKNRLIPVGNRKESTKKLLACLIKPLETADWWEKMLALVENIARNVPCYNLQFDKSGDVRYLLERL